MIDFNTFEEVDVQQEKGADEQPEEDQALQDDPAVAKKEDEESSEEEEKADGTDEKVVRSENDNDDGEEANSSQKSDPVTPPSPLSKDEDSDDAEAEDKDDAKSKDSGDLQEFFGNILKQRNLDTEVDDDEAKNKGENDPTNNDPMGIMMSNSIMQSAVVGNENFEEDDDELDIFAESNKNEPMRNPILGGGNNNSSMNYSVMDNSQMNVSVSASQQQPQNSNNIRGHVANIIDNNLNMHQSTSQEDSSAYIDKIIEIQVYIK